ncbi:MAG: hypothetical protein KF790_11650 [Steroidobacteraceae bacterium]|nr:hypothetical protein [Steroidobacteraceae bacterium]MCW5573901.1 hypothetical protein [Steroidobacteraceae bacterium]
MSDDVFSGIVIGAVGGGAAGLVLWLTQRLNQYEIAWREKRRIYSWLHSATSQDGADRWRSTRAIASYTDLTEDRVRHLCSIHPKIALSSGENEVWGIKDTTRNNQ